MRCTKCIGEGEGREKDVHGMLMYRFIDNYLIVTIKTCALSSQFINQFAVLLLIQMSLEKSTICPADSLLFVQSKIAFNVY